MILPLSVSTMMILFLHNSYKSVRAAQISCIDEQLSSCVGHLQLYLDAGVEIFRDANDTFIGQICGAYLIKSECISVFMYYCPTVRKRLQNKVKQFDYACNAEDHSGNWPYLPTISPTGSDRIDEELAAKEKENLVDSAIKASVAAAVTILLILVCVLADCASKWRIRQRIQKAAAQAEQPLLKNADTEEAADGSGTEQAIKKEQA